MRSLKIVHRLPPISPACRALMPKKARPKRRYQPKLFCELTPAAALSYLRRRRRAAMLARLLGWAPYFVGNFLGGGAEEAVRVAEAVPVQDLSIAKRSSAPMQDAKTLVALPRGLADVVTDESLLCAVCCEVLSQPVNGQECAHVFCQPCLHAWTLRFASRPSCPICRTLLGAPVTDAAVSERLASTRVSCTCGTAVVLSNARAHADVCKHAREGAAALASAAAPSAPPASPGGGRNRVVFACPLCPASSGSRDAPSLAEHVAEAHAGSRAPAVCPICVAMPWGDPTYVSSNWAAHVHLRHRFEYAEVVPINEMAGGDLSEEAILRAVLEQSAREAGVPFNPFEAAEAEAEDEEDEGEEAAEMEE